MTIGINPEAVRQLHTGPRLDPGAAEDPLDLGGDTESPASGEHAAAEPKTSAQLCRENGWGKGTVLEQCAKGCGPSWEASQIRIVAVTEEGVLAYRTCFIESTGRRYNCERWDRLWDLTRCTWKAVAAEPAAGGEEGASELERLRARDEFLTALEKGWPVGSFSTGSWWAVMGERSGTAVYALGATKGSAVTCAMAAIAKSGGYTAPQEGGAA